MKDPRVAAVVGIAMCLGLSMTNTRAATAAAGRGEKANHSVAERHGRGDRQRRQLVITSAFADLDAELLEIRGRNLSTWRPPRVSLAGVELEVVNPFSPDEILAVLPPDISPGSYLLTVTRGRRSGGDGERQDSFDLTIGTVGPRGERGDTGPEGPAGPQGEPGAIGDFSCPPGEFLIAIAGGLPVCGAQGPETGADCALVEAGADLGLDADLRNCDLSVRDLTGIRMVRADLTGASLAGSTLDGAVFSNANLTGAELIGAQLNDVTAGGADFTNARLAVATGTILALNGAKWIDADLCGATLLRVTFLSGDATGARLSGARLTLAGDSSTWAGANLQGADLSPFASYGTDLQRSDLRNVTFRDANLTGVSLWNSDLTGADLTGAILPGSSYWGNTTCPDGTSSDDNGDTCEGHRTP